MSLRWVGRPIALGLLLLGGCATGDAIAPVVCPVHVQPWTNAQQLQILSESNKLAETSILLPVLLDYASMRAEARACQQE